MPSSKVSLYIRGMTINGGRRESLTIGDPRCDDGGWRAIRGTRRAIRGVTKEERVGLCDDGGKREGLTIRGVTKSRDPIEVRKTRRVGSVREGTE